MMTHKTLVLFAHGARAAGWAAPFERLRAILQARLPDTSVQLAFLELMTPDLPSVVAGAIADGCMDVSVVPVFLGQGGHLLRDLPLLVDRLRAEHPGLTLTVAGAVGEDASVLNAIADYCVASLLS